MRRSIPPTVLLLALLAALCANGARKEADLNPGDAPPERIGRGEDGKTILMSALKGRVVIVTFWASWCAPCRKEILALEALQRHLSADKLLVLAVNWQEDDDAYRAIKRTLKDFQLTLTHDGHGELGRKFGVNSIPHMFIIGKDGRIAYEHSGYGEGSIPVLVDDINAALAVPYDAASPPAAPTSQT
jgi:thiol-disulfide isomerase/thioredoxin